MAGLLVFRGILVGITDGITIGPVSPFFGLIGKEFLPSMSGIALGAIVVVGFAGRAVLRAGRQVAARPARRRRAQRDPEERLLHRR